MFVEFTQLLYPGLVPTEADPNTIDDIDVKSLEAAYFVALRDVRDDSERYAVFHLNDRSFERFVLVVGHHP